MTSLHFLALVPNVYNVYFELPHFTRRLSPTLPPSVTPPPFLSLINVMNVFFSTSVTDGKSLHQSQEREGTCTWNICLHRPTDPGSSKEKPFASARPDPETTNSRHFLKAMLFAATKAKTRKGAESGALAALYISLFLCAHVQ